MRPYPKSRLIDPAAAQKGVARVQSPFAGLSTRRVPTRLLSAGLWFVAAAVVLWGLEYRLSLYRPHPGPADRAAVAKLWVDSRSTVAVRSGVSRPTHDLPIYFAEALRCVKPTDIPFRLLAPPANSVDARSVSASPRSPPYA
jgi:hypothetical protein